ncbi:UNVERIFIED_ORG: hypothetical protein JN05_02045 [Zoogloea ramigera]|uniref:Lipoprotein n=1 Tax=Duganella zoogloeoides TaxID=75659 RepID=A0ABZ0Y3X1_9BURK|nr:hypothetical protein [Duganella zoogloeoides]WQH06289.1 hypothetical protein SR858_08185 [Duganella zoogloeoides]
MKKLMAVIGAIALLALAGCGSSDDHAISNNGGGNGGGGTTPPVSMVDAFYAAVLALIGDGAETTTEPVATDSMVATAPEDTEPVAVK